MLETKLDCQLVQVLMFLVVPASLLSSTVSVAIWIPRSASAPQVGFMSRTTSPILEEKLKFQGRRRTVEVPCSGVSLESLAGF